MKSQQEQIASKVRSDASSNNDSSDETQSHKSVPISSLSNKRDQKLKRKLEYTVNYSFEELDREVEEVINLDPRIVEMQQELQLLKKKNLGKKDLQIQRNRITAQLSRDRKKLETDILREELV